jgi:TnpA family transposase
MTVTAKRGAGMKKHEILSPQARAELFDPPTDTAAIVRHYTFSPEDMALIRQRRRAANRLGFAVLLSYLRFPGRVQRHEEAPPTEMLAFISDASLRNLSLTRAAAKRAGSI